MKQLILIFFSGAVFALGLIISGMTQPAKVQGFLDFFGNWDPTLMSVMLGAIAVHGASYIFIRKLKKPLCETQFHVPTNNKLDAKLLGGSAIFGIGWALGGFCPGPALVSLGTFGTTAVIFTASMIFGMYVQILSTKFFMKGKKS